MNKWVMGIFILILLLLGIIFILSSELSNQINNEKDLINVPCTFFLTVLSGVVSAFLCNGNILTYASAPNGNASGVLNAVLGSTQCSSGCNVFISSGTFTMNNSISSSINYITIDGLGTTSKITTTKGFAVSLFIISGSNWLIRNLGINGTNITRGLSKGCIVFSGSNDTAFNNYLLNCDHPAINLLGNKGNAISNRVVNATDDGISTGGNFEAITNNFITTTANHNGISLVTSSFDTITGNIINHTFYGIGIENLGAGSCLYDTLSSNIITDTTNNGINIYPNSGGVSSMNYGIITSNVIIQTGAVGIEFNSGTYNVFSNNVIKQTTTNGIEVDTNSHNNTFSSNTISFTTTNGIDSIGQSNTFSNNVLSNVDGGIITNALYQVITGNTILNTTKSGVGIQLLSNSNFSTVTGNHIVAGLAKSGRGIYSASGHSQITGNTALVHTGQQGLFETGTKGDFNTWSSNFTNSTITENGNNSVWVNNKGLNPIGVKTNFVYSQGAGSGGNWISPIGTSSTLVASTTYTISITSVQILVQAVGLATISINGGVAITPIAGDSYYLYPGQTINFGAFGVSPPTIQVIFS